MIPMYSIIMYAQLSLRFLSALLFVAWIKAIRNIFVQVWLANTYHIVPQATVDFIPNIIQTYQYISCVHCRSVQLYSFENHILAITQQFLVLHKGVQQQTNASYQKSMLVVTATS